MANKVGRPSSKTKKKENNNYDKLDNFIFHISGFNSFAGCFAFITVAITSSKLFFFFLTQKWIIDLYGLTLLFFFVLASFILFQALNFSLNMHIDYMEDRLIYVREKHKKYWKKR